MHLVVFVQIGLDSVVILKKKNHIPVRNLIPANGEYSIPNVFEVDSKAKRASLQFNTIIWTDICCVNSFERTNGFCDSVYKENSVEVS